MFEATDIREWRGHDVVDTEGQRIGELEAIYVDTRENSWFALVVEGKNRRTGGDYAQGADQRRENLSKAPLSG